uniref:Uncharacterized protein n=1 Tax=Anguilla anguilla TaxID=7936 RepID=A0A0E9X406_ANGAN
MIQLVMLCNRFNISFLSTMHFSSLCTTGPPVTSVSFEVYIVCLRQNTYLTLVSILNFSILKTAIFHTMPFL